MFLTKLFAELGNEVVLTPDDLTKRIEASKDLMERHLLRLLLENFADFGHAAGSHIE